MSVRIERATAWSLAGTVAASAPARLADCGPRR